MSNDKVLLEMILEKNRNAVAPQLPKEAYFNIFCAENVLKDYELDYDEIKAGIVEGGGDGGIDAVYGFANSILLAEDTDPDFFKKDVTLELIILSDTISAGFREVQLQKIKDTIRDLLNLAKPIDANAHLYNESIKEVFGSFKRMATELAATFPRYKFRYYYVTLGNTKDIGAAVRTRADALVEQSRELFPKSECSVSFLGARELHDLAAQPRSQTHELPLAGAHIGTPDARSYICLVRLRDLYNFIADPNGNPRRDLLEANVRDYVGPTEVNKAIADTLRTGQDTDFWWLNNGATIIATEGRIHGDKLILKDPRVVNGLQTSIEIHRYFRDHTDALEKDNRNVLVKVIVTEDEACRDLVIRATNSQTAIAPGSLRATDRIHRSIEQFLEESGLYYDRRKGHHKNEGRPIDKIISIPYLAQAVVAIMLQEPDNARARPSSLLKNDERYLQVFNEQYPLMIYLKCVKVMRKVDEFLRQLDNQVPPSHKTNLRFHLAMWTVARLTQKSQPTESDIENLDDNAITDGMLQVIFDQLRSELTTFVDNMGHAWDEPRAAKSKEFRERVHYLVRSNIEV